MGRVTTQSSSRGGTTRASTLEEFAEQLPTNICNNNNNNRSRNNNRGNENYDREDDAGFVEVSFACFVDIITTYIYIYMVHIHILD